MTIALVVPSIRPESLRKFLWAWDSLIDKHKLYAVVVQDGDDPEVYSLDSPRSGYKLSAFPGTWRDVVYNRTDACRNLGFLFALKNLGKNLEYVLTLDDDLTPHFKNDPIQEHLDAFKEKVPISWFRVGDQYTRGFPYGVRSEAEVWISVGVWQGTKDWDGPTQLVLGNPHMNFHKGPIPNGCLFPFSGMNVMWKKEALPHMYFAPMGKKLGVERFADIFMGVSCKRALDELGKAIVTGYSTVYHDRASNVFANLQEEARGIKWNETWWKGEGTGDPEMKAYFDLYSSRLNAWQNLVRGMLE